MPFPFDVHIQNDKNLVFPMEDKVQFFISFTTRATYDELKDLYRIEMEQLGWREVALFDHDAQQWLFMFEKPTKRCTIILRALNRSQRLVQYYIAAV
jgi:hypothetical protein